MSYQVYNYRSWSKETAYHSLRVHQGRMGCTPKGTRIPESQQQYTRGFTGQTKADVCYKADVRKTVKIESTNCYSDKSLQTCHCSWTKKTTYHGLRVHQGKMGCTPKGERIPKEEQSAWKDWWKQEMDNKKLPVAQKGNMKQEKSPETPSTRNFSNPTAATRVKKENNSSIYNGSKSRRQSEERITPSESPGDYWSAVGCNNYATAASGIKEEPISPPGVSLPRYPYVNNFTSADEIEDTLRYLLVENISSKMNPQLKVKPAVQPEQQHRYVSEHPGAPPAVPREKKDSLLPASEQEAPRAQLLKEIHNCLEKFEKKRYKKMISARPSDSDHKNVGKSSRISTDSTVKAESMEKNQSSLPTQQCSLKKPTEAKAAAVKQRNKSASKHSIAPPPVPPRKESVHLFTRTPEEAERSSATKDGRVFQLKEDSKEDELVQVGSKVSQHSAAPPVVPPKRNLHSFRGKQLRGGDVPNDPQGANDMRREMVVKELVRMFSISATQEKAAGPKGKLRSEHPQVKSLSQRPSAVVAQEIKVQSKVEDRKEQVGSKVSQRSAAPPVVPPKRNLHSFRGKQLRGGDVPNDPQGANDMRREMKSATDKTPDLPPTAAEEPLKEAPSSLFEADKPDISTSMKVKELAQMFSVLEAATGLKERRGQERKNRSSQKLPESTRPTTKMKTVALNTSKHQEHKSSDEASQPSGFSTGPKVKDLARMFSA